MTNVLVLYFDGNRHRFERLQTSIPHSTDPADFNLAPECDIILVLMNAQYSAAILNGSEQVEGLF